MLGLTDPLDVEEWLGVIVVDTVLQLVTDGDEERDCIGLGEPVPEEHTVGLILAVGLVLELTLGLCEGLALPHTEGDTVADREGEDVAVEEGQWVEVGETLVLELIVPDPE